MPLLKNRAAIEIVGSVAHVAAIGGQLTFLGLAKDKCVCRWHTAVRTN